MSAIRVGCCGFAAGRREYYARLSVVEVQQTFHQPPKPSTVERWRAEAPGDFAFTVKAWQLVTHEPSSPTYRRLSQPIPPGSEARYGSFRDTEEVWAAWQTTRTVARALAAQAILFQCPASFTPTAEHKAALRRFFARAERDPGCAFVLEPRGVWEREEVEALCAELDLVHAIDPLQDEPALGAANAYWRLHGPVTGRYRYSDDDLHRLRERCESAERVDCLFNNVEMWKDANRFARLVEETPAR